MILVNVLDSGEGEGGGWVLLIGAYTERLRLKG